MIVDIPPGTPQQVLHDAAATRRIEAAAAGALSAGTLMQRAGEAVARLTLALAPTARHVWVLCGPGNNGGDGFEAALWLHRAGWQVHVTDLGDPARRPADAAAAFARAAAAGVPILHAEPPAGPVPVAIDALFGLGASRPPGPELADLIDRFNAVAGPRLAVDLPSGLDADTGLAAGVAVRATDTLSLLTLKPGLFTAAGRDHAGRIWLDDLGSASARLTEPATARTVGPEDMSATRRARGHQAHKGSFGDVLAVGGAPGMVGALRLAARAALAGGAGRVYACALDPAAGLEDAASPEVMWRPLSWATAPERTGLTVVAGCGGSDRIAGVLPAMLSRASRLVLDADALNAIAGDTALQHLLAGRAARGLQTVLTPHPLEAARLLGQASAGAVQADRLAAARSIADRFECTVLLKGSGTVIAGPGETTAINTTGNARLATAGSGDVLAGWLAGLWSSAQAAAPAVSGFGAAAAAAYEHGLAAGSGPATALPLTASALLRRLTAD